METFILQNVQEEFNNIIHCGKGLPNTPIEFLYQKEKQMKQNKLRWEDIPRGAIVKFKYSMDSNYYYYIKKNSNTGEHNYISRNSVNSRHDSVSSSPHKFDSNQMEDLEIIKNGETWFNQCFKAKKVISFYYDLTSEILQNKLVNIFKFS